MALIYNVWPRQSTEIRVAYWISHEVGIVCPGNTGGYVTLADQTIPQGQPGLLFGNSNNGAIVFEQDRAVPPGDPIQRPLSYPHMVLTSILWPILERISAVHLRHGFPLLGVLTRFRYMNPRGVVRRGASLVGQESLSLPE